MRKILFGILLSVLMVFSSVADDITCGVGTEPLYTQLEYIEATGTQYIKTGALDTFDQDIEIEAQMTDTTSKDGSLLSVWAAANTTVIGQPDWEPNLLTIMIGDTRLANIPFDVNRHIFKYDGTTHTGTIDSSTTGQVAAHTSNLEYYLFASNENANRPGSVKHYAKAKIYSAKIGTTRDFIPVRRNSDGAIGMYDRVSGEFFGNSGTGEFIAGPVVGGASCFVCGTGYYNSVGNDSMCTACPVGYNAMGDNATDHDNINDCKITCAPGYYVATSGGECVQAPAGYYAPNKHSVGYGQTSSDVGGILQCPNGQTSGPGAAKCRDMCGTGTEPFTQLEYIEFTGTQWIDTGFFPTQNTRVITKVKFNNVNNMYSFVFGAGPGRRNSLEFYLENKKLVFCFTDYRVLSGVNNNGDVVDIDFNQNVVDYSINGIKQNQQILPDSFFVSPYSLVFGNLNRTGNPGASSNYFNLYDTKIYDGGTLVRDFVPVRRESDGAVGMYDRVERKFYGNDGTGEFIAGPDVGLLLGWCNVCATGYYNDTGNNTACVACPAGYNATGDNASDHDNINDCKITCGGGFYLSSQYGTECAQTGVGYWSPSHTYLYGDTGIRNQCPDGLTTIGFGTGADEFGDCGMKFHVGNDALYLRSERKTSPTLNVEYGGRVFYGNMVPYAMPMNADTTRKLHVEYNGVVYSVHDDSVGE